MSEESSIAIIKALQEKEQKIMEKPTICTLYTFAVPLYEFQKFKGVGLLKVARLTDGPPFDWHEWPDAYCQGFPQRRLLEIEGIEIVDDRTSGIADADKT